MLNLVNAMRQMLPNDAASVSEIELAAYIVYSSVETLRPPSMGAGYEIVFVTAQKSAISANQVALSNAKYISPRTLMSLLVSGAFSLSSSIDQLWLVPFSIILLVDGIVNSLSRRVPRIEAMVLYTIAKHGAHEPQEKESVVNNAAHVSDEKGIHAPLNGIYDAIDNLVASGILQTAGSAVIIAERVNVKEADN